jgi:hypothetical protein
MEVHMSSSVCENSEIFMSSHVDICYLEFFFLLLGDLNFSFSSVGDVVFMFEFYNG